MVGRHHNFIHPMPIIYNRPTTIVAFSGNDIDICHDSNTANRVCESLVFGQSSTTNSGSVMRVLPFGSIVDFDTNVRMEFTDPRHVEQLIDELTKVHYRMVNAPGPGQEKIDFTNEERA